MKFKLILVGFLVFLAGGIVGGALFSRTIPRSFLAIHACDGTCYRPNELIGLLASVGIQNILGIVPNVVQETDKTIAFDVPDGVNAYHYVVIPKKDIKNAGTFGPDDAAYLVDAYAVMSHIARERKLDAYRIYTNGPGRQHVTYLHFHLLGN